MSKILEENVVDIEKVIYGESIQDGIPTPENPVEIKSKKIFNSNYIQRVNDIQCPLLVAISQEEYTEYKSLENQLKQRDEVIDEAIRRLNSFIDNCKAEKLESGSDYLHHQYWDMFERFNKQVKDILQKYKGDSNE